MKNDTILSAKNISDDLKNEYYFYCPEYIKISYVTLSNGDLALGFYGQITTIQSDQKKLIQKIINHEHITLADFDNPALADTSINFITQLYNDGFLAKRKIKN
jgi:hypothetical protein